MKLISLEFTDVACSTQVCQRTWFAENLMSFVVYKTRENADQSIKALEASSAAPNGGH
uniref:Uncharacterized protein n=1 Tax=Equus asinus TaxID=9793 RepID=A0A8C4LNW2_EQUAS